MDAYDFIYLAWLDAYDSSITDLTGLQGCYFTQLESLFLGNNQISDITPLAGMSYVANVDLSWNQIIDISPLAEMSWLENLWLGGNQISDISPLAGLGHLHDLSLHDNQIGDITPLAGLTSLSWLDLSWNQIIDILPLVNNPRMRYPAYVDLTSNPLSSTSCVVHIPTLESRGVNVEYDPDDCP